MPKFKICLINPPVLTVLEPWYDTPDFGRTGLAYLAGYLRQYEGFDIKIIDAKLERLSFQEVLQRVIEFDPKIVGLTAFTNEIKPAAYQAALIKKSLPEIVTVIGGVHVTAIPKETLQEFNSFDIGVVGEGEVTFYELCSAIKNSNPIDQINGLVFRGPNGIQLSKPRLRILDQDSIPLPAWDLLPRADTYFIQTLRGCPFDCKFCMNPNGKVARKRSVESVMNEIHWIIDTYQAKRISFGDELFSVDMERTRNLLDAMAEANIGDKIKWDVQTHVRFVDLDLFHRFKKAKVDRVEMGIETGDEDIMKKMGKGISLEKIVNAYENARIAGVDIGTFFIIGQPNENKESIRRTIQLATKINPKLPMFGVMTPYPGTEVGRLAAKGEGGYKLLTTDWDEYNKQIGGAMEFANLNRRKIEWIQIKAYTSVFLKNGRVLDFLKLLWEYRIGALSLLKKMIKNQKGLDAMLNKPTDYDALLASDYKVPKEIMVSAMEDWKNTQKSELSRAKKEAPDLFNIELT